MGTLRAWLVAGLAMTGPVIDASAELTFTAGDFYGTNYFSNLIVHYDATGAIVDDLTIPAGAADDVKGIAFGPDGLLYAVTDQPGGLAVLAIDGTGTVHNTYPFSGITVWNNLSYGKITFGSNGDFYVAGGGGVARFQVGDENSGTQVRTGGVFDVEALPSGNLLIVTSYDLYEITSAGDTVREIAPQGISFTDNRGVEYDPASDSIFVTMLGHTGAFDQLMKFEAATGQLITRTTFNYGDDIFLATDGRLIVGSRTQSPGFFDTDLGYLGSATGSDRMFITQYVPEPGVLFGLALGLLSLSRRASHA